MSETCGRCRREITAAYERTSFKPNDSDLLIADAIDRLAADMAAVKAKVEQVAPEDVRHLVESEKAFAELFAEQRDAAWAEVERLKAELAARPAANSPEIPDSSPAAPQPAAPEPAYYLVTNERDRPVHVSRMHPGVGWDGCTITALYAAPQPAAPPWGWLTEEERELLALVNGMADAYSLDPRSTWRRNWPYSRVSLVVKAILARAGSPPVVEVPELPSNHYARSEAERYRVAIDAAGVSWKEVGRE